MAGKADAWQCIATLTMRPDEVRSVHVRVHLLISDDMFAREA